MTKIALLLRGRVARDEGFTLVELLITIFLFAILTTILMTTVLTAANNFKTVRQTTDLNEESRLVLNRISRELRQASRIITPVVNPDGPAFDPNGDVAITFEVDFNRDKNIVEADGERLTYLYDRTNPDVSKRKRLLLKTTGLTLPILASNVEAFKLSYTSSDWRCDSDSDGVVTWLEVESAPSPCPEAAGNSDSPPLLDVELTSIDAVTIYLTVLTGSRRQEYRTRIDLRNRV